MNAACGKRFEGPVWPLVITWMKATKMPLGASMKVKPKAGVPTTDPVVGGRTMEIPGRGKSVATVKAMLTALNKFFSNMGGDATPPGWNGAVAKLYASMKEGHTARNPTADFPLESLPSILANLRTMPRWSPSWRNQAVSMEVLSVYHGLRVLSLSFMCPEINMLRIPPVGSEFIDPDGVPRCIAVGYTEIPKETGEATMEKDTKYLLVWRNPYFAENCPVCNILMHVYTAGLGAASKGPPSSGTSARAARFSSLIISKRSCTRMSSTRSGTTRMAKG